MSESERADSVGKEELEKILADASLPPAIASALRANLQLERIELDAEGGFWHKGEPFQNEKLMALFHRSIHRTPGGTYLISIPPYSYPIVVAEAPRQVRHVRLVGDAVMLLLSDGTEQQLAEESLCYVPGRGLYCLVDAPDGQRWSARFLRPAYYELLAHLEEEQDDRFVLVLPRGRLPIKVADKPPL